MSKKLTAIPYVQFFTGDAERFISEPVPYLIPRRLDGVVAKLLDAEIKFGVKAYNDDKATRIFTYRNHDHNDVVEVIDVFKGASNEDIDYAHRRLVSKTANRVWPIVNNCIFDHDGKSA